jgi:hypothetical protein
MKKSDQDILARAYAMLQSLRQNVDKLALVEEIYVNEYHGSLDIIRRHWNRCRSVPHVSFRGTAPYHRKLAWRPSPFQGEICS